MKLKTLIALLWIIPYMLLAQEESSPIATSNYVAGSDASFVVPLDLGFAKTFILGKTPVKETLQGQYFVTRPDVLG